MSVRRNILTGWFAHAVTLLVGLFLVRYVKDTLGDDGYGAWIFVNSVAGYSGLLYMGFGAVVCRWSSKYHTLEDWPALNRIVSSIFAIYAANSLLALVASAGFSAFADRVSDWEGQSITEVRVVILLLGLNAAVGLWGSVFSGLLIGIQRYDLKRWIHISTTLVRLGLIVGCLHLSPGLISMALVFLAITVVENIAYYRLAKRYVPSLHVSRSHVTRETFAECFSFTAFNALGMISEYLIYLTDTVMIGCLLGTAATVPYYIALRLCQMARQPLENVAEVVLPKAGELYTRGDREGLRRLVLRAGGLTLLLIAGFAIGCAYFGDRLLVTWLGTGNESSAPILMVLVVAQVVAVPCLVPKKALMGMGLVRVPALIDLLQAIVNLGLSLLLVRNWGVIGVAWGTLIPIVLCEVALFLPYVGRTLGISWRVLLREVLAPQVLPLTVLLAFCEVVSRQEPAATWLNLLAIAAAGGGLLIGTRGILYWLEIRTPVDSGRGLLAGSPLQEAAT